MSKEKSTFLPHTLVELIAKVKKSYTDNKSFSEEDFLSLHSIFGTVLEKALEILDRYTITIYKTSNSRCLIQVASHDTYYKLFQDVNYCSCQSFKFQVLGTQKQYTCKHVLAAILADITGKIITEQISEEQFNVLLESMVSL